MTKPSKLSSAEQALEKLQEQILIARDLVREMKEENRRLREEIEKARTLTEETVRSNLVELLAHASEMFTTETVKSIRELDARMTQEVEEVLQIIRTGNSDPKNPGILDSLICDRVDKRIVTWMNGEA